MFSPHIRRTEVRIFKISRKKEPLKCKIFVHNSILHTADKCFHESTVDVMKIITDVSPKTSRELRCFKFQ